jgi:hypothetical protein
MDSFAPYKNSNIKKKAGKSLVTLIKFKAEAKIRVTLKEEANKQDITLSIIPSRGTGYI